MTGRGRSRLATATVTLAAVLAAAGLTAATPSSARPPQSRAPESRAAESWAPESRTAGQGTGPPAAVRAPRLVAADAPKVAVLGSAADRVGEPFSVVTVGGATVLTGTLEEAPGDPAPWSHAVLADFSALADPGTYRVVAGGVESAPVVVQADPYPALLDTLLGVYDANADGREPSTYHRPSHLNDARSRIRNGPHRGERVDVTGGWMDSGDQLKFTVTTAYAATLLQLAARHEPGDAALSDAADVGVRWLRRAHPAPGIFVAQVGDVDADHDAGFRDPAADDDSHHPLLAHRPTEVLTPRTRGADVAGLASAALALAAQRADGPARARLVRAAEQWYALAGRLGGPWRNCCYRQDTVRDDLGAAAVELWRATGEAAHRRAAVRHLVAVTDDGRAGWRVGFDGYETAGVVAAELCGVLGAPAAPGDAGATGCRILRAGGADARFHVDGNAFGRAGPVTWGTVRQNQAGALASLLAGRAGLAGGERRALRALGWFLGANPWGVRFQAGHGVDHPYHWASLDGSGLPAGAVVGGPAPLAMLEDQFPGQVEPGPYDTADAVYRDHGGDWVTNEVGIPYSAGSVLLLALLSAG